MLVAPNNPNVMHAYAVLYFELKATALPSPLPPKKEVFQLKLSCQSLQWLTFHVRFVS